MEDRQSISTLTDSIRELFPQSVDEKGLQQILQLSRIISKLPIGAISKGAFAHTSALHLNPKMPFIPPVREALLSKFLKLIPRLFLNIFLTDPNDKLILLIKQKAEKSIKFKPLLEKKIQDISQKSSSIPSQTDFETILKKLEDLLDILESLLKNNRHKWFLSDSVSILDICLGVLLYRLDLVGLEKKLWAKRPEIASYMQKILSLPSFQLSIPSTVSNARAMWGKFPDQYKYAGLGLISASSIGLMGILGKTI